jgi:hypothetical protein
MVPEQDAQHTGDGKNQGKPKEEPLLPEPIDIRCTKQFQTHALLQYSVSSVFATSDPFPSDN